MDNRCEICDKQGSQVCSNCGNASYCGKDHQKEDWRKHKIICRPYKIVSNEIFGRYLIASRNIKAGEIILKENPIVVGPEISTPSSKGICLGCYAQLSKKYSICDTCKIAPLCSSKCPNITNHTSVECDTFKQSKLTVQELLENMQIIMPLRCMLLKNSDAKAWDDLIKLEGHEDKRRNTAIWVSHEKKVLKVLEENKLINQTEFTPELQQKINGILDVNTFELRLPGIEDLTNFPECCLRGLFLEAALMAHDCIGNTHISVDDNFTMTIHASVPINKNQEIYFNYTNGLQGTFERQQHLQEGKYFECDCERCLDPTELGTYMSSLLCTHCKTGFICPPAYDRDVSNWYKHKMKWTCNECEHKYRGTLVNTTLQVIKDEIQSLDKSDVRVLESALKKYLRTLHPNHTLILDLKQGLIGSLRYVLRVNPNPGKKVLSRKMELCKEILPILEIIEPGISRLRGIALYEMHIPMVVLANKEYDGGQIKAEELLKQMLEADSTAREAIRLLLHEPAASPEGRLAKRGVAELKMLSESIASVRRLVDNENSLKKGKTRKTRK